jgi:hypothetical protein
VGARRHAASGRLYRGCPWLRPGPQGARAAPPPASCLELFRRRGAALRQAAAALPRTWCACRAACRLRVPVKHAADRRLRDRKVIGLPARARHDERRVTPWPVRSCAYHLKGSLQTTYSNRLKRAMLPWPWELTVAQAAMARLHRLLVPRLRVHPEPWLMSIDWERLNHSDDEPLCGASRRSWAA